ncbi:5-dehydro-4-deoxyglucarate dehydratase [Novosphingobium sp. FSY-8]|uniref:Probable 5-dehydro-4-deoxyglucarate dehydratase n=1 Tax=Novosphingobium ovatum TaxID=1908523 RepID=A0ABW9X9Z9_9SPHN|nr:5-dehydro-4-deoxyglucarate dehydratase [Novosphingobium ovatum]NBC35347.1 5-dehydro-4-deoxyglucarate dehydratase [Novosphingobium ovatum]
MAHFAPQAAADLIGSGLLSFPVTHFTATHAFDEEPYRAHCDYMLGHAITGIFPAGGTGEFFSLMPDEVERVVRAAAEVTAGRVPVIAGCGYGTAQAVDLAQRAKNAGADALLLLPAYLVNATQEGLAARIEAVCRATDLGVIVYNRDNGIVTEDTLARLCERNPNLVGFKDGVGDIELMMRIYAKLGDRLTYVGGLPTAETFAPAYLEMGVTTYSSAIFNFMPEWALRFYAAVRARDHGRIMSGLRDFVMPYLAIRNRGTGYAVSIVKAGVRSIGRDAGPVRAPLTDLLPAEQEALDALIAANRDALA